MEVLTGGEGAAGAGEEEHASATISSAGDGVAHLQVHGDIEAIELVGAVQREPGYTIAQLIDNSFVISHLASDF